MLNIAVVGLGWWGRIIVDLVGQSDKLRVVRVADVNPQSEAFARERELPYSPRFEDVLADPKVQGVVLCTPHSQHTDQIVAAAQAGKHVFCEKPLSMSRADVLRAVAAVEKAGVALAVGHEKRFEPPVQEIMKLVKSGALGTPLQVEANFSQDKFLALASDNWRLSGKEAPAGPMTATGIHLLDLSVGVFGEADTVHCSVKQLGSPLTNGDTLAALVTFRKGGHALISAILATPFAGRFAVYGSQGWAEVRDKTHPEAPQGWTLTTHLRGGEATAVDIAPAPAVLFNLEAFADAAEGRAPYPVPREQMIANVSALEAIFRSAKSGAIEKVEG
ncbi:Gfo/Idh/MocA family oxidoreductase [Ramlibacter ginsenosidimutans]|uniref:Gfo/Idh/MocA family oxidoreductase n=1 Tax=Ramlibacter ginsenosidimutans TaxID=502333 RepID=A0A934WLT0_9BURK|nr:Gfo/Idh/MocA family oxidoreductase [Ramlibacter ginsenosidimutans]MBK6005915.1 Gfo/Idh/MocA family oxidoreductase [Ramlibacter ginsenosidimutans]